jgi:2-amino-4-hydroxy-6-hydroxymethyldihydropteridine diphosphokinase
MLDVAVGLGTNLGDREATLRSAALALRSLSEAELVVSALYETAPVGPPQPHYLNAAVRLRTSLALDALLEVLLDIERAHGRVRRERWGPRTLDLDVLFALSDGEPVEHRSARLVVPHPHLLERSFALAPLLDVMPELEPRFGAVLAELGAPDASLGKGWTQGPRRK